MRMAMQSYVFMNRENLPTVDELNKAIAEEALSLTLPIGMSLSVSESTFVKGDFEGLESCFDYLFDGYNPGDWEWTEEDVALIGDSDGIAVFNTYSNAQEIVGMLVTACVLTKHCDGVLLSDFFEDELIGPDECMGFLQDRMPGIREQFNGPSKMRR